MESARVVDLAGLGVDGEACPRCLGEATEALLAVPGVREVCRQGASALRVGFDPGQVTFEELERRLSGVVSDLSSGLGHRLFTVLGMDCPDCAATIERAVGRVPGVRFASLNFGAQRLLVEVEAGALAPGAIEQTLRGMGYRLPSPGERPTARLFDLALPEVRWVLLSGLAWAAGALLTTADRADLGQLAWWGAALTGGLTPARRALAALRSGGLDMNCLMILAVLGALGLGESAEAATVIFLFSVGEMLEGFVIRRSRRTLEALLEERPDRARVCRGGEDLEVPAREVLVGERVRVRPGERIPLDGRVLAGASSVNQAPVTGESAPVEKGPGDSVFAGCLNGEGVLEVEVEAPHDQGTLARVLRLVEEAQARKSTQQRFIDRFAARYTPAVMAAAALTALVGPWLSGEPWSVWGYRALVMLVVACPCALVISVPVSLASALTGAVRRGILIKGGVYLEGLAQARAVALDKTGTLTVGLMRLEQVVPVADLGASELLRLAASLERDSEHPLGAAVVRRAREEGLALSPVEEFLALPGRGVRGRLGGAWVEVGRPDRLVGPEAARLEELGAGGATVVAVWREGRAVGLLAFGDRPRPEAGQALEDLAGLGQRLIVLTGDQPRAARALTERFGLGELHAGLLPEEKLRILQRLESDGFPVIMVGDGINDAPSLAAATVGVAMGAVGSPAALEAADVALLTDDLRGLGVALRLARRARRVIHQNIALALGSKALFLALALGGWANMWMAILADVGATLLVTLNGLRLVEVPGAAPVSAGCPSGPGHEHGHGHSHGHDHGHSHGHGHGHDHGHGPGHEHPHPGGRVSLTAHGAGGSGCCG